MFRVVDMEGDMGLGSALGWGGVAFRVVMCALG